MKHSLTAISFSSLKKKKHDKFKLKKNYLLSYEARVSTTTTTPERIRLEIIYIGHMYGHKNKSMQTYYIYTHTQIYITVFFGFTHTLLFTGATKP